MYFRFDIWRQIKIKHMFEKKYYTRRQRKLYGWGWFAISFILGIIFVGLEWNILAFLAFAFGIMSIVAIGF